MYKHMHSHECAFVCVHCVKFVHLFVLYTYVVCVINMCARVCSTCVCVYACMRVCL